MPPVRKPPTPAKELARLASELGPVEQRILVELAKRLRDGERCYGRFNLSTDRRDFRAEAAEEALDLAIYAAAQLLRGER
jgi:hypothetical protein